MITTARPAQAAPTQDRAGGMADPLQRHALRDPLAAPVQRKNLAQTGLLNGITLNGTTAPVSIPNVDAVNVYEGTLPKSATRLAALTDASASQAVVGKAIAGKDFTADKANFNKSGTATLDPFVYRVKASYGDENSTTNIALDYQNSQIFTGYVIKVNDGASGKSSSMENALSGASSVNKGVPTKYSNRHASTGGNTLSGLTDLDDTNKTQHANEEGLDAMTKIAGEGARWQAVRKHAAKLTDSSWFFARTNNAKDPDVNGVSFKNLWLSWAGAFDKAYDISDATFASKVKTMGAFVKNQYGKFTTKGFSLAPGTAKLSACDANDYDLDNSKSHTV